MIVYTNLMPRWADGMTIGPVILIRPSASGDAALLAHEHVHVDQWKRSFGLFWLLYSLSKTHRLRYEVEAYRAQLAHAPHLLHYCAALLATRYRLNITFAEARRLLTE